MFCTFTLKGPPHKGLRILKIFTEVEKLCLFAPKEIRCTMSGYKPYFDLDLSANPVYGT